MAKRSLVTLTEDKRAYLLALTKKGTGSARQLTRAHILLQARLNQARGLWSWWLNSEWNLHKRHAAILGLRRLFWRYWTEVSQFLVALEDPEKVLQFLARHRDLTGRIA
jgi:hypothetical protein